MKRRHVLAALAGAVTWPFAASSRETPVRIGFLAGGAPASIDSAYQIRTIKQGLADNGLVDGRDYLLEPRFATGHEERFAELTRDLAGIGASIVLVNAIAAVRAVQRLAPAMAIVMIGVDDPVGNNLIAGFAKPGGRTTGIAGAIDELAPKMVELHRAVLPAGNAMAVLYNPASSLDHGFMAGLRAQARAAGLSMMPIAFQSRDELEAAFGRIAKAPPAAIHVMLDPLTRDFIDRIPALALMNRLPAFAIMPEFAAFGGLIGYGPPRERLYLGAGAFVRKVLDGARAGDLPVAPPPRSEVWINRRTAEALRLTLPAALLASADKIIG